MANPKLNRYQVAKIKRDIQKGVPLVRIAADLNVSYITVVRIKSGDTWADVGSHELPNTFYVDHGNGPEVRHLGNGRQPRADVFLWERNSTNPGLPFSDEAYEAMQGISENGLIGEVAGSGKVTWNACFFDANDKKYFRDVTAGVRDLQKRFRLGRDAEYRLNDGRYVIRHNFDNDMTWLIEAMDRYYYELEQKTEEKVSV